MSPPRPRVNTFTNLKSEPNIDIDKMSKSFIIAGWVFGINRVSVMGVTNRLYTFFIFGLPMFFRMILFYIIFKRYSILILQLFAAWNLTDFIVCTISPYIFHKNLFNFYLVLNRFDQETGFQNRKIRSRNFLYNYLQLFLNIVLIFAFNLRNGYDEHVLKSFLWFISQINHCLELHYYAHLFILVIPRLQHLNWCIELSYPKTSYKDKKILPIVREENIKEFSHIDIKKLLDFYNEMIIGFDYLNVAIRWQSFTLILTTFATNICIAYLIMKTIIYEDYARLFLGSNISVCVIELGPLLALCAYAEQIRDTVRQLKENLTSRIFQNTLDKSNRSAARAFLMLIEKCDMSFCLFQMFDIDITLPFKLGMLLLTYLVTVLQFDKLINPTN